MATSTPQTRTESDETDETAHTGAERGRCPECDGRVIEDGHERTCGDCGLVVDGETIDRGPEWRAFDSAERENKKRTGPGRDGSMVGNNLGSKIARGDGGLNERQVAHHDRSRHDSKQDRNKVYATTEIDRIGDALDAADHVRELGKRVFRESQDAGDVAGRDLDTVAAASLHLAGRVTESPLTAGGIAEVARSEERSILRRSKDIRRELGLSLPPADPATHVPAVVREVAGETDATTSALRRRAESILEATDESVFSGRHPAGVAAAAVWCADKSGWSGGVRQADVASAAGVCAVTVRNTSRELDGERPTRPGQRDLGEWAD